MRLAKTPSSNDPLTASAATSAGGDIRQNRNTQQHGLCLAAAFSVAFLVFVALLASPLKAASITKIFATHASGAGKVVDHSAWDRLLKAYVIPATNNGLNRVRYGKFKAEGAGALKSYIAMLEAVDPTKLGRHEQYAYWINLYNAKTVEVVLDKYPVKSIKSIRLGGSLFAAFTGGPWKAKIMKVNGVKLSLDDIEHGILRPNFKDPRIHYAVNCASVGCPNLAIDAFTGAQIEKQLDRGAKTYINSPRGFKVEGDRITASSIYKWFDDDFGGNVAGVLNHAGKYASAALKAKLQSIGTISNYGYDWTLNDAK